MITLFPEQFFVFPTANNELECVCLIFLYTCCNSTPNTSLFFKPHPKIFRYIRNSIILLYWRSLSQSLSASSLRPFGTWLLSACSRPPGFPLVYHPGQFLHPSFHAWHDFHIWLIFLPDFLYSFCEVYSQGVFRVTLHGNKSIDTVRVFKCFVFYPNVSLIIWLKIRF